MRLTWNGGRATVNQATEQIFINFVLNIATITSQRKTGFQVTFNSASL